MVRKYLYTNLVMILSVTLFNNFILINDYFCGKNDPWCGITFSFSWFFIIYPISHIIITYIFFRILKYKRGLMLSLLSLIIFYILLLIFLGGLGQASQIDELIKLYFSGILAASISFYLLRNKLA